MSDATKAGARHSAMDMAHIRRTRHAAREIVKSMRALGDDGMPVAHAKAVQIDPSAHPGAMIALMLDVDDQQALRDATGLPDAECDHVTLAYLGGDAAALEQHKNDLLLALTQLAQMTPALEGSIGGVARFNASESSDNQDVCVALYDDPALPDLHAAICACVGACGIAPPTDHGFTPHITLAMVEPGAAMPIEGLDRVPLSFDAISLIWGGERIDLPLLGGVEEPPPYADAEMRALDDDDLTYAPVGAIKAIGDYTLRVRGIVYGGRDLSGDYFTKQTDLGFGRSPIGMPVYYDHAERGIKSQIGHVIAWEDTGDAIDFDIELDRSKRYADYVMGLERQKALGGSSGAMGHLVVRDAGKLKRWIIGELSLTPTPMEPRTHKLLSGAKSFPEVAGDATTEAIRATTIQPTHKGAITMPDEVIASAATAPPAPIDMDALKTLFGEMLDTKLAVALEKNSEALNDRLKAIENSPALKTAGYISDGTHIGDKEVKSFGDFALCIRRGNAKRLRAHYKSTYADVDTDGEFKALNEESGGTGGYTVPIEFEPQISKIAGQMAIIEPLAFPVPMSSVEKKIPMLKQTENATSSGVGSSGFFGGMYFTLSTEGAVIDEREPEFAMMTLHARKLAGLTIASNELREDSATIESELLGIFGEGMALAKDYLHLLGNGVGQPIGMLSAVNPARKIVGRVASGAVIEIADVTALMANMIPSLFGSGIFLCHPTAIQYLMTLQLVTNGDAAFVASANAPEGSPLIGRLINRPVYASEFMAVPSSSASGDLAFVAPRAYAVGTRRGILIAGSEHYRFNRDQYTWRITSRGDGQPRLDGTVKLHDGANTEVSAFVVLGP